MNNEINWIKSISPKNIVQASVQVGIGDDAAIYSTEAHLESVIAVDTIVEGIHFTKEISQPASIGHKALAVNISDLAAMGARPRYYLVSIAIPKLGWSKEELAEIYEGMNKLAGKWQMDLIGGDTVSIDNHLVITVTVVGIIEKDRRLLRSNARPNDVVFVTGTLGNAAYGLEYLMNKKNTLARKNIEAIKAHQEPMPQVEVGEALSKSGLRMSLNDISDGIASEAKEIAIASQISLCIDWELIPKAPYILEAPLEKQEDWVLYGGEDFQLIGTVSPTDYIEIQTIFEKQNLSLFQIGTVGTEKGQVFLKKGNQIERLEGTGYDHL